MKKKSWMLLLIFALFFTTETIAKNTISSVAPASLRCEYLTEPIGLDIKQPRLSWELKARDYKQRGQRQTAYRILVSSSKELLGKNIADLWDSGSVLSDETAHVVYKGKELMAGQSCYWKVSVSDEGKHWSEWSETARWSIGLFSADWKAKWIGNKESVAKNNGGKPIDNIMSDPWFRKSFSLERQPEKAMIYVASVGYHELYINGSKISNYVLAPSATDHKSRARYVSYDITKELKPGKNVIGVWLGVSWSIFPAYQTEDKPAIPLVMAQTEITLSGNKHIQIITDDTWKTQESPNALLGYWDAHHFEGEIYDATLENDDWCKTGFNDLNWNQAAIFDPKLSVSADKTYQNHLSKEIIPISIEEVQSGIYCVDMGINYAGWYQMQVEGNPGDTIEFKFSEKKGEAASFGLRSIYIIGASGKGTFSNRFNYMSGRWIQISGLKSKPLSRQIKGWMIRPNFEQTGHFECDIPLLNDIYNTSLWTFENLSLGNYVVDCPQRERRGYGGDALATTRMALDNYDLGAFYTKWMEDWRDVQQADGNVPYTAPTHIGGGGPSWSGYIVTLPWEVYCQYGDRRILEESLPSIKRWLSFLESKSADDMLVRWGGKWGFLGDWLWPQSWNERKLMESQGKALGDTKETLFFNNCIWIYNLDLAAQMAEILGDEKSLEYRKRADEVRKAVHSTFFNEQDYSYVNGYPAYLAMALYVNLPPQNIRANVWKRLEEEISVNRKGHFWGGITAGSFLFYTLLDNDKNDLIYTMAMKEDFPSWGNMIKQGLGTYFEDWECRGSALHSSYLYIGSWFTEALGGIKRPRAGYKQFVIEPWISRTIGPKSVKSHYHSLQGTIVSNWNISGEILNIEVTVPPNTETLLRLKNIDSSTIKEGGKSLKNMKSISFVSEGKSNETTALSLKAGKYNFTARLLK